MVIQLWTNCKHDDTFRKSSTLENLANFHKSEILQSVKPTWQVALLHSVKYHKFNWWKMKKDLSIIFLSWIEKFIIDKMKFSQW